MPACRRGGGKKRAKEGKLQRVSEWGGLGRAPDSRDRNKLPEISHSQSHISFMFLPLTFSFTDAVLYIFKLSYPRLLNSSLSSRHTAVFHQQICQIGKDCGIHWCTYWCTNLGTHVFLLTKHLSKFKTKRGCHGYGSGDQRFWAFAISLQILWCGLCLQTLLIMFGFPCAYDFFLFPLVPYSIILCL